MSLPLEVASHSRNSIANFQLELIKQEVSDFSIEFHFQLMLPQPQPHATILIIELDESFNRTPFVLVRHRS